MVTLETFLFASKQIYFLKILFPPVKYFMVTKKKITFYFKYLFSLTIANNVTKFFMFSFYRYLSLICKPSNNRLLTSTRLIFLDIVLNGQFLFRQYVYTRIYTYRVIKQSDDRLLRLTVGYLSLLDFKSSSYEVKSIPLYIELSYIVCCMQSRTAQQMRWRLRNTIMSGKRLRVIG